MDLILQTGVFPIKPSRGSEGNWLNPINTDGVNFFENDPEISSSNLEQALIMQRSLNIKPELESTSDNDLNHMLLEYYAILLLMKTYRHPTQSNDQVSNNFFP